MVDFSHLSKTTPQMVARHLQSPNPRATDEMYFEALTHIGPHNFSEAVWTALRNELAARGKVRGRPRLDRLSTQDLIAAVAALDSELAPRDFVIGLSERLRAGRSFKEATRSASFEKNLRALRLATSIQVLYAQFREIDGKRGRSRMLSHPVLGEVAIPKLFTNSRHQEILSAVGDQLRRLGDRPPSVGRMRNICSQDLRIFAAKV